MRKKALFTGIKSKLFTLTGAPLIALLLPSALAQLPNNEDRARQLVQSPRQLGTSEDPFNIKITLRRSTLIRAPTKGSPTQVPSELALCQALNGSRAWERAIPHCEAAVLQSAPLANDALKSAFEGLYQSRESSLYAQLRAIEKDIRLCHFKDADFKLTSIRSRLAADHFQPTPQLQRSIYDATSSLASATHQGYPLWLTTLLRYVTLSLVSLVILLVIAPFVRWVVQSFVLRYRTWVKGGAVWRVATIEDKTGQNAIGAVMDALNTAFNPLFRPVVLSSYLAVPPGINNRVTGTLPRPTGIFRNFLLSDLTAVRPRLSILLEFVNMDSSKRHRFKQVSAFEQDVNVKIAGVFEASIGAVFSAFNRWACNGMPTVTGAITFVQIDQVSYAQVRLVASWRRFFVKTEQEHAPDICCGVDLADLFASGETLSAFATTPVQADVDAVSLAAQRVAFRLIYRMGTSYDQPNLGIAASCYRQGVRLLSFSV